MHELAHDAVSPRLFLGMRTFMVEEIVVTCLHGRKFVEDGVLGPAGD